jgi:coenzyme F420-reducing hydrogenase beta subunit
MSLSENDPMGLVGTCPTCQAAYPCSNVRILKQAQRQTLFHLSCEQCHHAMLFAVQRRKDGVMCSGLMTDCTFEDAQRFHAQEGVSIGDVMAVHEALDGAWKGLISTES